MEGKHHESYVEGWLDVARKALWGWEATVWSQMGGLEVREKFPTGPLLRYASLSKVTILGFIPFVINPNNVTAVGFLHSLYTVFTS
jgi:hypothetical protein